MEPELRGHLVTLATLYAGAKRLEIVTVARHAAGDWRFFDRLDDGKTFTARKYDDVVRWFAEHWPADVEWPQGVPAPVQAAA